MEILTVIAIIAILVGLLFAAMKYARNSAATSRTKAQLDTLRGMLGELDAANKLSRGPSSWLFYEANSLSPPYVTPPPGFGQYPFDFWKQPYSISNGYTPPYYPDQYDALDSPGDVGNDGLAQQTSQRNASFAVLNTQLAMQMLAAIPANKTAIDNLPANAKMMPVWNPGPVLQPATFGPTMTGLFREDGQDPPMSPASNYVQGMHVTYQGKYYVCVAPVGTAATNADVPGSSPKWVDESANPRGVPLLLDGWGNPIIFVPATGLHVKLLNGQGSYLVADPPTGATQEYIIISPEGSVSGNGTGQPLCTHPGRPFFASAGPDGDFVKGDDNLYSFNN